MSTKPKSRRALSRWFWGGFLIILGMGVLLALFAAIRGGKQWAETSLQETDKLPPPVTEVIQVTLAGGESVYIDSASVERIRAQTRDWMATRREQALAPLLATIDRETAAILAAAEQQVPAFADWHFSLTGEYARLFHAAAGNLPEYIAGQLEALVFAPAGTAETITRLGPTLDSGLEEQLLLTARDLQSTLARLVRDERVEAEDVSIQVNAQWALGAQFAEHVAPYVALSPQDMARQGAAVTAGVGVSAAAAKKIGALSVAKASAKIATTESAGLIAAAASKMGVKALAGAGTGAASGAALCTGTIVGAPLAPGCALVGGIVTGVATWLLVDKAVIEAEELLRREEFEAELRQALSTWRDELREEFRTHYTEAANSAMDQLSASVENQVLPASTQKAPGFVPADAASAKP